MLFRNYNEWDEFFDIKSDNLVKNQVKRDIIAASPINIRGNTYSFNHKTIMEFFISQKIYTTCVKYHHLQDLEITKSFVKIINKNFKLKNNKNININPNMNKI